MSMPPILFVFLPSFHPSLLPVGTIFAVAISKSKWYNTPEPECDVIIYISLPLFRPLVLPILYLVSYLQLEGAKGSGREEQGPDRQA